jgi:hypothetical protein
MPRINGENYSYLPRLKVDKLVGPSLVIQKIAQLWESAQVGNLRDIGAMSSPPTVTANGTALPAGQTNGYLVSTYADLYRTSGGTRAAARRLKSAVVGTTGGNIGDGAGGQVNWGRYRFIADANKIAFRVSGTTAQYRFIVDGQYVSLTGTVTTGSAATPDQYLLMDFTSSGGRQRREIIIEMSQTGSFIGAYVGATEKIFEADESPFRTVSLGDSYCYGTAAEILGDGVDAAMADYLGWSNHMNSGSGGTGWATTNAAYRFDERIANGDLTLNGGSPDIITLQGSINDKNASASSVTSGCLAGIRSARGQFPNAIIFVFGVWNAPGGAGTLSATANEAAIQSAVSSANDDLVFFIPISSAYSGAWLSGTGNSAAPTGNGNADVWLAEASHLNEYGTYAGGYLKAQAIYRACVSYLSSIGFSEA